MIGWQTNNYSQSPPLDSFPSFSQGVIVDISNKTQAPVPLICVLMLGVMAEACQGGFDIEIPDYGLSPLSLWILAVASSGVGKTPVERLLRKFIQDFEDEFQELWKKKHTQHEADLKIWLMKQEVLHKIVKSELKFGSVTTKTRLEVIQHEEDKPVYPKCLKSTYSDATPAAIKQGLAKSWPYIGVITDEASNFFSGALVREWGTLNGSWENGRLICDRKDEEECVFVDNPRVSMILQAQGVVLERYFRRRGNEMRELGSLARFIVCSPISNQGYRFRTGQDISLDNLDEFYRRAKKLMECSIGENGDPVTDRTVLKFSPSACELFMDLHNQFEMAQQPGQWLSQAKDYASKATRHIARIAALLHLFEIGHESTEISWDTLNRASLIMNYFIGQYLQLFTRPPEIPQIVLDSNELLCWLNMRAQADSNRYIMRSDIQRFGPLRLRKSGVLDGILQNLCTQGFVGLWKTGKIAYVDLTPMMPFDPLALDAAIRLHRERRAPKVEEVIQQQ